MQTKLWIVAVAAACAIACATNKLPSSPNVAARQQTDINESSAGGLGGPDTPNTEATPTDLHPNVFADAGVYNSNNPADARH